MKLELNRVEKALYLDSDNHSAEMIVESQTPRIRDLFLQILEKYTQSEYISFESLEKARLSADTAAESLEKTHQLESKQENHEFIKNFRLLTETLKICLENLVLQEHAAAIKEIFGIGETHASGPPGPSGSSLGLNKDQQTLDQDLMHTLIPNFLAYFARTRLRYLTEKVEIMFMLTSICGQRIDFTQIGKEFGQPSASTTSTQFVSGIPESWLRYLFLLKDKSDFGPRGSAAQGVAQEHGSTRKVSNKWATTPDKRSAVGSFDGEQTVQHASRAASFAVPAGAEVAGDGPSHSSWSLKDAEFRKLVQGVVSRQWAGNTGAAAGQVGFVTPKKSAADAMPSSSAQVAGKEPMLSESFPHAEDDAMEANDKSDESGEEENHGMDATHQESTAKKRKQSESIQQASAVTAEFRLVEPASNQTAGLGDFQVPIDIVAQMCKSIVIGSELLKAEFFRALVEYHKKREDDRNKKKEILKKSLYKLAEEVHGILMKELEASAASSSQNSLRTCILCEGHDDHTVCGKLIHLRKEEWIHANCALWSEGVVQIYGAALSNMYQMIKKVKGNICPECGKSGASMTGHTDTSKRYHLVCALKNKCVFSVKGEKKIMNLDAWVKNCMNIFPKHFKNCSILYFLFCTSLEMITTFRNNRKVFVQKKQSKGIAEPARTETLTDLSTSIRELALTRRHTVGLNDFDGEQTVEKLVPGSEFGQMSRIGNLMILGVWDITQLNSSSSEVPKTLDQLASIRKQWIKFLRKESLPQSAEYIAEQKNLLCLVLRKFMVARFVPEDPGMDCEGRSFCYHVYELDVNPTRTPTIFSVKLTRLSKQEFLSQLEGIHSNKDPDFRFESPNVTYIDQKDVFGVLFDQMGFKYSEVRAFLSAHLKAQIDNYMSLQLTSKNLLHYRNVFYNCIDEQHILLDIREKYSIYDRIKLIWQINSDLESSREFVRDMGFAQDSRKFGTRSKINPKSRSFCDRSLENLNNSDGSRGCEKLINQLIGNAGVQPGINKPSSDPSSGYPAGQQTGGRRAGLSDKGFGGKKQSQNLLQAGLGLANPSTGILPAIPLFTKGGPEKNLSAILRKGYNSHKTTNIIVAPSDIHKYGKDFSKDDFVVEYIGEIVRNPVSDIREKQYEREGFRDCFMFRLQGTDSVIDATFIGNQARYLNHSCDPNCGSIVEEIDGHHKLFIYALKNIAHGEELTYDYKFEVETEKLRCLCGSANCLGRLN